MRMKNLIIILSAVSLLSSCVNFKNLLYLQETPVVANDPLRTVIYDTLTNVDNSTFNQNAIVYYNDYLKEDYLLRPFDQLSINVASFETNTVSYFNSSSANGGTNNAIESYLYLTGYTLDGNGMIQLPLIGDFRVEGLTTRQVQDSINKKLEPYLNLPISSVKLGNFRITMLGEVRNPGQVYIFNNKTNILQALGMAGDLGEFANNKKIKLIRETDSGVKSIYLDLSNPNLMISEYFYVRPNDVIYIEPIRAKAFGINTRFVSVALSSISVLIVVINLFINLRN